MLFKHALAIAAALSCCVADAQDWKPTRNLDITVTSSAGGAADRQARVVQRFLQAMPGVPSVSVSNRAGGAGAVAWTALSQHAGDAHYISTINVALVTNHILGVSKLRHQDLTPLNILVREYIVLYTRVDSPIATTQDLLARLKKDPASVTFGFSPARGNQNHIVLAMVARAAGVDPRALKTVVYAGGAPGMAAMLGGHLDVWAGALGGALPHMRANTVRVLGVSADKRQPGFPASIPTFREQGVDASYYAWRGFIGPGRLSPAQIAFWEQAFARIVRDDEWKKVQEENSWGEDFRGAAETRKHLDAEYVLLQKMLADLGVIGKP